jgi:hypothetical protein
LALLLFLVTAYLAVWIADRALRPTPIRDRLILLLLPLVETGPALAGGRILAPVDLAWLHEPLASMRNEAGVRVVSPRILYDLWTYFVPAREAVREAIHAGEWPLWNPYVFGGAPLLATSQAAVFHPLNLVSLLLPLELAVTYVSAMTLVLAAICMYHLARDFGAGSGAALFGATAWTYGAFQLFWLGWPLGLTAATVPLLMLAARRVALAPGPGTTVLLAAAFALSYFAGSPEVSLLAGLFAGALFLSTLAGAPDRGAALRRAAMGTLLGLGVGAVQLLPFVEALPQTAEYRDRRDSNASGLTAAGWGESAGLLAENLVPFVLGVDRGGELPRREPGPARATSWIGAVGLATALIGFAAIRGPTRWVIVAFLIGGVGLASYLPGFVDLARAVPVLSLVRPRYGWLWASLALSILSALGTDELLRGRRRFGFRAVAAATAAGATVIVLGRLGSMEALGLSRTEIATGLAAILVPLAVASLAVRRRLIVVLPAVAIGLTLLERQMEMGHLYQPVPAATSFPPIPELSALSGSAEPFRVVGVRGPLRPNTSIMWGLQDVRGYDPMSLARYVETYPIWAPGSLRQINRVERLTPFLDFLNVRFALAAPTVELVGNWRTIARRGNLRILENPSALPRVFVPRKVRSDGSAAERLGDLAQRSDFLEQAWLEPRSLRTSGITEGPVENPGCAVELAPDGPGLGISADCVAASWLVTSIPAWRGWQATSAGAELPMAIANHAFVAVRAPAGRSRIELAYRPSSFFVGGAVTLLSLGALIAIGSRARAGRRPPGTGPDGGSPFGYHGAARDGDPEDVSDTIPPRRSA